MDADLGNVEMPEPGDVQPWSQYALVALCMRHSPSKTIESWMLRVFLDRAMPCHAIHANDTLLAMLTHKKYSKLVLTTVRWQAT